LQSLLLPLLLLLRLSPLAAAPAAAAIAASAVPRVAQRALPCMHCRRTNYVPLLLRRCVAVVAAAAANIATVDRSSFLDRCIFVCVRCFVVRTGNTRNMPADEHACAPDDAQFRGSGGEEGGCYLSVDCGRTCRKGAEGRSVVTCIRCSKVVSSSRQHHDSCRCVSLTTRTVHCRQNDNEDDDDDLTDDLHRKRVG